jgi:DNA-binding response OmpR family regulator
MKVQLRRVEKEEKAIPALYSFGDIEIDFAGFKVQRKGKEMDFTSLEMEVLKYFVSHPGKVITRDELLDKIWGYESYPTTRTIDNHILKLRKKIEEDPSHPRFILSVYGGGYRFTG